MKAISMLVGALLAALLASCMSPPGMRDDAAARAAIDAAIADPARPEADRARDAERKPAESLAYAGVRPGDRVLELLPGRGYYTRILSGVVGARGHVYAAPPPKSATAAAEAPDPGRAVREIAADPRYANVSVESMRPTAPELSQGVDLAWTSQNYHDLHNVAGLDLVAFNRAVYAALRPGGTYIVLDHAAQPGSGARDTNTLHRIDPETVVAEARAAGFELAGRSDILTNPADPHAVPVFDASIRGRTDQFILKFRKPR